MRSERNTWRLLHNLMQHGLLACQDVGRIKIEDAFQSRMDQSPLVSLGQASEANAVTKLLQTDHGLARIR